MLLRDLSSTKSPCELLGVALSNLHLNPTGTELMTKTNKNQKRENAKTEKKVHFVEDLETRRNAGGPVTTHAVGEEGGGGGW